MKVYQDKKWLIEHYVNKKLSLKACAEIAGLGPNGAMTIRNWLFKNGIPTRGVGNHMRDERNWRIGKPLSEETKQKIREKALGRKRSYESRLKQSQSVRGQNNSQYGKQCHGKGFWIIDHKGRTYYMRSLWEVAFADWLTGKNIDWEYEPQTFILPDGSAYTPDFLVNGVFYEIKGFLTAEKKRKFELFKTAYPEVPWTILFKDSLIAMGVLDQNFEHLKLHHLTKVKGKMAKCPTCKREFVKLRKRSKYCSLQCALQRLKQPRKQPMFLTCPVCNKVFRVYPSELKHRVTCSVQCGRIHGAIKRSGINHWTQRYKTNNLDTST